ncbi:MAG: Bax inhibitor-1/YccA family protein [Rhodospirillaceae bacterium]
MAFEDRKYMTGVGSRADSAAAIDEGLRKYMLGVYNYMASGVALTGIVAWLVANTAISSVFFTPTGVSPLMWVAIFAPIGLVLFMSARISHMKASTAQGLFWAYAALNGISLSLIFVAYTDESIARVFFITAATFAGLSLWGYTTKRDLSGMGSFLFMGLIGIIIASVVNIFLGSSMLQWILSVAGVLVFAGLTAYDTQQIKEMYFEGDGSEAAAKKSVMGALRLYLDFINMFVMLMHLFGNRE